MAGLTLAAVGDISFGRCDIDSIIDSKGPEWYFADVENSLAMADLRFGNMESVMIGAEFPREKLNRRALHSSDRAQEFLKFLRFDLLNQATNHVLDCGWAGLEHTYRCIKSLGAVPLGASPDLDEVRDMKVIERNGLKIGFLAYVEPFNWTLEGGGGRVSYFDPQWAVADIARVRKQVDCLIVSLHAGLEFHDGPSVPRVNYCRKMVDAGADIILCHHSHVPQGVEFYNDGLIAYSLGNFCFTMGNYLRDIGGSQVYRSTILKIAIGPNGKPISFNREHFRIDPDNGRPEAIESDEIDEAIEHHEYLDEIVTDEEKLHQRWYEAAQRYIKQEWPKIQAATPENFIETVGWRIFGLPENRHWLAALWEMANHKYSENAGADYQYDRPNSPFEGTTFSP